MHYPGTDDEPLFLCPQCGTGTDAVCGTCGHVLTGADIRQARDVLKERVRAQAEAGVPLKRISEEEGLAIGTVSLWTRDCERPLTVTGKDGRARPSRKPTSGNLAGRRADVQRLVAEGLTNREIAAKVGATLEAIKADKKALRRRERGEAPKPKPRWSRLEPASETSTGSQQVINEITTRLRDLDSQRALFGAIPVANVRATERLAAEWQAVISALKFTPASD